VTENVQDSVTGRILLIPQSSRLIGSYDSVVAFGQKRALVVWQRIILPDGSSIRIDNVPANAGKPAACWTSSDVPGRTNGAEEDFEDTPRKPQKTVHFERPPVTVALHGCNSLSKRPTM